VQSPRLGRPNGLEVNPRGQGLRGYGSAARRVPAFEARDAGGVTPCKIRWTRRLGRRTEAGPRRVLPRVRRRFVHLASHGERRRCGHDNRVWWTLLLRVLQMPDGTRPSMDRTEPTGVFQLR